MKNFWYEKPVVVTGGASFIGSHLVDRLCSLGADVTVVDDFSSGRMENLKSNLKNIKIAKQNLETDSYSTIKKSFAGAEVVFHLAAIHGGRGFIDTHPADCSSNFAIDHRVYDISSRVGVDRIIMASSACAYPPILQDDKSSNYLLREIDSNTEKLENPLSADREYGWAKLMGEVQLRAFVKQYGINGGSLRFVTAYGPRENETHAIIALIHKAYERMDPYVVWGDGKQLRDFTYVDDIVSGTLLAGERLLDGSAINLGTGVKYQIRKVAEKICKMMDFNPRFKFDRSMPIGVVNRGLDNSLAKRLLGWTPKIGLEEGLSKTIDWYVKTHKRKGRVNEQILFENKPSE